MFGAWLGAEKKNEKKNMLEDFEVFFFKSCGEGEGKKKI